MRKRVALSRGKDSRTTLPPVCGTFHSHSLLRSLPMPTTCRARTERCSSLHSSRSVYRPTRSPRCGRRSGLVRLVGDELAVADIGSRLTYSRVSACCAAPTPDICHRQTHASGSLGHYHCALHLNPAEKVLAPAAYGSTRTAIAEAHTAVSVAIGYRLAAPHRHPIGFSLRLPNAQSSLFRNACAGPVAHSPPSIGLFSIPIPCKPNALPLARQGLSVA